MRAIWLREFGPPEVLVADDAPDPEPAAGELLVDVAFASITFVETQFRAGLPGPFAAELPVIPGNGVGGVVTAAGAGVDGGLLGARVVSSTGGSGGYAQRAVVDAAGVVEVPDGLALDSATALLADGRTALLLLDAVDPQPGERVLVEAAAGGVGSLLVQLAAAAGARVAGVAGGERKRALVEELGAELAVDYREPGWEERVRSGLGGGVDMALDGVGGAVARAAFGLLDPDGRMLSYGLASGTWSDVTAEEASARQVTLVRRERPGADQIRDATERALALAAAGELRPLIGQRFPLEQAADAHDAIESRASVGKTLLEL
jgi:NADPH:quinone reductase-like Zn-dependent oxidoreductase